MLKQNRVKVENCTYTIFDGLFRTRMSDLERKGSSSSLGLALWGLVSPESTPE
jgi:hypothetical protein